jgi:hypothetical protein
MGSWIAIRSPQISSACDDRPVLDDDRPEGKVGLACLIERHTHEALVVSLRRVRLGRNEGRMRYRTSRAGKE